MGTQTSSTPWKDCALRAKHAITCDPFAFETIKQQKNKEKNQDVEVT
jgi:hypothetical protein